MDKRRIIEKVHPLIVASINKYAIGKGEFEDLYQEGIVKILELLKEFDEDKG
ncbi:MAG: sigma factor, partial [Christensenellales bacterium]